MSAIDVSDNSAVTDISADATQLATIKAVGGAGGTFNLSFTASKGSDTITTTVQVVVANTLVAPTLTTSDCEHYVGDAVDTLHSLSASNYDGTAITIDGNVTTGNTKVVHGVPITNDKFTTPGTYLVTYKVKDQWGNEGTATKQVKVHGLPTLQADFQIYELGNVDIEANVGQTPVASWKKASDTVGSPAVDTSIAGPAVEVSQATAEPITYEVLSGPNGSLDFSEVGIYEVEYIATNPDGKMVSKVVEVLIVPEGTTTEPSSTLLIAAKGFTLENADATSLNEAIAKDATHANVVAYRIDRDNDGNQTGFSDISANVGVYAEHIHAINAASSNGGIYDLTFQIEDAGKQVSKKVKVVVKGTNTPPPVVTPDGNELAITAKDFTLTYEEAKTLNETMAIQKAGAEASLLNENPLVSKLRIFTNTIRINANQSQVAEIKTVAKTGGDYDLTFIATYTDAQNVVTTTEVKVKVHVDRDRTIVANQIGTGDENNQTYFIFLLILSGVYVGFRYTQKNQ